MILQVLKQYLRDLKSLSGMIYMNVLILGGNGLLGPYAIDVLSLNHKLRITDINDFESTNHEYLKVDVSNLKEVIRVSDGMDAIINLSVVRRDRQLAFDVNARGCYNVMAAATNHGIKRVINTGPPFIYGARSLTHFNLNPDVPSSSGTALYTCTKSIGHEICKVFTRHHPIWVMTMMFGSFRDPADHSEFGNGLTTSFIQTYRDAARVFRSALEVDLNTLPSRCELFNVCSDVPGSKYTNEKTKRLLGWYPEDSFVKRWIRITEYPN